MIHQILTQRFNHTQNLIYMATSINDTPYVRALTPYYENGAFYIITDANSSKMKHIEMNPKVAICGSWFNASGLAINLGSLNCEYNKEISNKLIDYCDDWIKLGKVDINNSSTCILKIQILKGYVINNDKRYEIDFS